MQPDLQSEVNHLIQVLQEPVWHRWDFWLLLILSLAGLGVTIAGLVYSILAFREARLAKIEAEQAKRAATEAGRTVRAQTVAIELSEIAQKLEGLKPEIKFSDARELFNEVSRRLRRAISPFAEDASLKTTISAVRQALDTAQSSLKGVRPTNPLSETETPGTVYNGVEADFLAINNLVADLLGLVSKRRTLVPET